MGEFNGTIMLVRSYKYQTFNSLVETNIKEIMKALNFGEELELFKSTFLCRRLGYTIYDPYKTIEIAEEGNYYLLIFTRNCAGYWERLEIVPGQISSLESSGIFYTSDKVLFDL